MRNTYDGTARIAVHIGAFRFVCTNLAVGGGGAFAGGFVSIHAGEIPIEQVAGQLADYLTRFGEIVRLYRMWSECAIVTEPLRALYDRDLHGRPEALWSAIEEANPRTVFEAYNLMTNYATHRMRTARRAFDLLERINSSFQRTFPVPRIEAVA